MYLYSGRTCELLLLRPVAHDSVSDECDVTAGGPAGDTRAQTVAAGVLSTGSRGFLEI